jgi:hypothetical protein
MHGDGRVRGGIVVEFGMLRLFRGAAEQIEEFLPGMIAPRHGVILFVAPL